MPVPAQKPAREYLHLLYVCGSRALGAVNHLKLYLVTFIQCLESTPLNS